ncbi:hypothetical protein PRIC1_005024 [Phytophthora ramorum]
MGLRTLGFLLCVLTTATLAHDMATNSSSSSSESVAQLLADVQAAVADDPALANLFDISGASQMSESELTTLLQELLNVSLSGSASNSSDSASGSSLGSASAESTQSASAAGSTVSSAATVSLSTVVALAVVGALCVAL